MNGIACLPALVFRRSRFYISSLLTYQGIRVLLWLQGTAIFPFLFVSCMRLLNSIHDEIGNRRFACWFCLDFSLEIAVQTNRSKGMYKGDRRKEVCRLFGRQKHTRVQGMHIAS